MTVPFAPAGVDYAESRQHELKKTHITMVDGNLTTNSETTEGGSSVRVFNKGYWGFASTPAMDAAAVQKIAQQAANNAATMCRFGDQPRLDILTPSHHGEHRFSGRPAISQREAIELLEAANAHAREKYPHLKSASFMMQQESHAKRLAATSGSEGLSTINRAVFYMILSAEDNDGRPVELMEAISGRGGLSDLELSMENLSERIAKLHAHLVAKCHAVAPKGGKQTVIISPQLAGILAHEAMGHPCEADLVMGGAVTGNLVGKPVASALVTMVDLAHSYQGEELMIPVYMDDEGTAAKDVTLIDKGILRSFMTNREAAAKLGIPATGSARAYTFNDEPLIRMRNTAILPGTSKLEDMIADVEDGYYLLHTGNGQADSTTEFMFGITLAYEIKNGKIGNAIKDTTVSGTAINMLKTVDAVSDDMYWECHGYCGKKQPMVVSVGGPALRAQVHMGGE